MSLKALEEKSNGSLDLLVEAIADAVVKRLMAKRPNQRLLSVIEAAEYLGRTAHAVRNLIAKRTLPAVRQDGRVFIDREDLDRLIRLNKVI